MNVCPPPKISIKDEKIPCNMIEFIVRVSMTVKWLPFDMIIFTFLGFR